MKYHSRDQFLNVMSKLAAESELERNTTTQGQQSSPPPKKEGPAHQQASPPSILMEGINERSTSGTQGEMKPEKVQPDEMKPTSPFNFRGPDESMSAASETSAKANASGSLAEDFENFVEGKRRTQADLKANLDNYGPQSAASSEQAKIGAARESGLLDELKKISASRRR
jgi:hypothetical protein